MADLQLNKPLYKSNAPDGTSVPGPALPRHPRPSLMPRMGAILLDVLMLHFIFLLFIKFAPTLAIRLGTAGEWVGLTVAWLYFAVCGSHLTWGRTLGKLTMRLQVCDVAGPDLPFGRAALRSTLLLWGCVFWIAFGQHASRLESTHPFSPLPAYVQQLGWAICWGWLFGNMLFSVFEPFGRTLYDRISGSAVTTTDSEIESLQEFLASARQTGTLLPNKAWLALAAPAGILLTIFTTLYISGKQGMESLPAERKAEAARYREALNLPGFSRPSLGGQFASANGADTKTTSAETMNPVFTYEHLGPIDSDKLKQDERAMGSVDRIIAFTDSESSFQGWIADGFNRMNKQRREQGDATTTVPKQMRLEVSFAEKADLFFASGSTPKTSISKMVQLEMGDPGSSYPLRIKRPAAVDRETTSAI